VKRKNIYLSRATRGITKRLALLISTNIERRL